MITRRRMFAVAEAMGVAVDIDERMKAHDEGAAATVNAEGQTTST